MAKAALSFRATGLVLGCFQKLRALRIARRLQHSNIFLVSEHAQSHDKKITGDSEK
jgi:hypothetical protein